MLAPWPPQAIPLLVGHHDDYEMDVDDGHNSRGDDDDEDDDIYIMMQCFFVTKNDHFLSA